MKPRKTVKASAKTWRKTRVKGLLQHRNGAYYTRAYVHGEEEWKPHETSLFSVAEARHAEFMVGIRQRRSLERSATTGDLTFAQAAEIYSSRLEADPRRKPSTKHYQAQVLASVMRDWPEIGSTPLKKVHARDCAAWESRHGAKASSTRFNAALGVLRAIFAIGIEHGAIAASPMLNVKRRTVRPKRAELPDREQFLSMLTVIRTGQARFSRACADFVAGLAFTGMRLAEAHNLTWSDVDLSRKTIHVRGDAETGTKNWETRIVPLIPDALALFQQMRADYPDTAAATPVFRVREAQKSLDRAAQKAGAKRMTHHDLRHLFATICIESGVDIPTVSRWLGHKDGGALAMRVYGHLREAHSIAAALKVTFAVNTPAKDSPVTSPK